MISPTMAAVLAEDQMEEIYGGSKNVKMSKRFLEKSYCSWYGAMMLRKSQVKGMKQKEIAKELFAHAICYYNYNPKGSFFKSNPVSKYLHDRGADGIYIADGGDTRVRKVFYNLCWKVF